MAIIQQKLVIVGDSAGSCSGKTSLISVYTQGRFPADYVPQAYDTFAVNVKVNEEIIRLNLWDIGGQDDFERTRYLCYPKTDVVLIAFSVDNHYQLKTIQAKWVPEVKHFCPKSPILLIGTKIDLCANLQSKIVTPEEGMEIAKEIGAYCYLECSSLWRVGVNEVFEHAIRAAFSKHKISANNIQALNLHTIQQRASVNKEPIGSPYDDYISMSSIYALEEMMQVSIVTPLAKKYSDMIRVTKLSLNKKLEVTLSNCVTDVDRLKVIIGQWTIQDCYYLPIWRSLLKILNKVNLNDLSQQIQRYLSKAEYLSTYRQVLSTQECIDMWFVKVIFLGAPRLGKTTARLRLTEEIEDILSSGQRLQPSTGAVESTSGIVVRNLTKNTALATSSEWTVSKDLTDEARMLIQFFHNQAEEKRKKQGSKSEEEKFENVLKQFGSSISSELEKAHTSSISSEREKVHTSLLEKLRKGIKKKTAKKKYQNETPAHEDEQRQRSQVMMDLAELFRDAIGPKYWKDVKYLFNDTAFLKMEDTGGQPEFMDMLPALTIGPALYLLFCKLTDELKSPYTVSYLSTSGESTIPEESTYTMEEVLLTALASISCLKSHSCSPAFDSSENAAPADSNVKELLASCKSSLAYIVGTHKDLVSEEEIDDFDKNLQESIRSTDFFKEGLVGFFSEKRMVLPIDNMRGGTAEVIQIQQFLKESLSKHFKKLSIPASWLVLSLCLRRREQRIVSIQSVLQLAKELGISENEAISALQFLHHYAGVLMYFPHHKDLKDMVICDTQIVYDSATNLIVNTFKFRHVSQAVAEKFREIGQFSLNDIKEATDNISGDYIPLKKLVQLLEHLNIIAPIGPAASFEDNTSLPQTSESTYFMPCVLQSATHEELDKFIAEASSPLLPAPLFYRYKCGYVPIGVFPATIACLAGQESQDMIYEGIKKNCVRFRFGSDYDIVTLISHPKYYAVCISRTPYAKIPLHDVCSQVRKLIESTLKMVTTNMNYSFNIEHQLAFECPTHPGREHLCIVASETVMLCLNNLKDKQPKEMKSQHLVWFDKEMTTSIQLQNPAQIHGHQRPSDVQFYVSSLPPSARPHLELVLDWGHGGVDKDLSEIADNMLDWEEKLAVPMGLTEVDIHDITKGIQSLVLQRREALRRWKKYQAHKATYGNLLELFVKAGHTQGAQTLFDVLRNKYPGSCTAASKASAWKN